MSIEDVDALATHLIRKYDWHTREIKGGVQLTVTDGVESASTDITTGENIEQEIKRLIEKVDAHEYPRIG